MRTSQYCAIALVALCSGLGILYLSYGFLNEPSKKADIIKMKSNVINKINNIKELKVNATLLSTVPTNTSATMPSPTAVRDFYIGLVLAISSTIFIGTSFILKKKGLIRLAKSQNGQRAGAGGYGYLKDWMWWAGFILMAVGEGANFAAYAFAPASLVTPLGALSVLVSAMLASKLLNERLNLLGKLGCILCILGSTVVVIHSPKESEITSMDQLADMLKNPAFIIYSIIIIVTAIFLIFYVGPRHGQSNPLVYIFITGSIGSLSVMGCKGFGVAITQTFNGQGQFGNWLTWAIVFQVCCCLTVQMNYLNKALDIFNTSVVTPMLYVVFTTFVITASAILFREWGHMKPEDIAGNLCGFLTVCGGIFLLNAFKDMNISLHNLPKARRELVNKDDSSLKINGDVRSFSDRQEDIRSTLLDHMESQDDDLDVDHHIYRSENNNK